MSHPSVPAQKRASRSGSFASKQSVVRFVVNLSDDSGVDAFRSALLHEAEHVAGDTTHLDLFASFGDPVAAVVPVDVLEGHMTRVAEPGVHLDRVVRRI